MSEFKFAERSYGKAWVKLLHVKRNGNQHSIREYEVTTLLTLESDKDYKKVKYNQGTIFSQQIVF